jgi:hypothetical protein
LEAEKGGIVLIPLCSSGFIFLKKTWEIMDAREMIYSGLNMNRITRNRILKLSKNPAKRPVSIPVENTPSLRFAKIRQFCTSQKGH